MESMRWYFQIVYISDIVLYKSAQCDSGKIKSGESESDTFLFNITENL